jgi:hypothetical protein
MTLFIFILFGLLFSILICGFYKPQFFFGKEKQYLYNNSVSLFCFSLKTAYLPFLALLFLLFIIFTAFRLIENNGIGGMDAFVYKMRFENATGSLVQSLIKQGNEPLYGLFVWIVRKITSDFRLFLVIFYGIIFVIQIKLLSKVNITNITVLAYFTICFLSILISFCLMRNTMSMFIASLAYLFLDKKKYKTALIIITMATFIHFSALICYPVWVACCSFDRNRFDLKKIVLFFCVLFLAAFAIRPYLSNIFIMVDIKYSVYLNSSSLAVNTFLGRFYILLLSLLKWKVLVNHNHFNRIMFVVLLFNFLVLPLQTVLPIVYRMLSMSDLVALFLIPELFTVYVLKKRKYVINLFIRLSLIGYLLMQFYSFATKGIFAYGLDYYANILL